MPAIIQKYSFIYLLQCLLPLLLSCSSPLYAQDLSTLPPAAPILASHVDSSVYYETLENCIKNSKKNIFILLSGFYCNTENVDAPVTKIIKALILARYEGIQISIVMNTQAPILKKTETAQKELQDQGLLLLKNAGIIIHEIETLPRIQSTLLIVDEQWVLESSQPWTSEIKPTQYFYSSTLINSPSLAIEKITQIKRLFEKDISTWVKKQLPGRQIFFPVQLASPKTLNRFIKNKNNALLDLYLSLLLKHAQKQKKTCHYSQDDLANRIFSSPKTKKEKETIIKTFLKILKRWDLLDYRVYKDGGCSIDIPQPSSLKDFFPFPMEYFLFNCRNFLSLEEKCIYILLLGFSHQKDSFPLIRITPEVLTSFSSIKPERFSIILETLEKNLLLLPRLQNTDFFYEFQPVPNRPAILKTLNLMTQQYGKEKIKKTQLLASQFNQEFNPQTLNDLIYYERELGLIEIQKMIHSVLTLPKGHPQRTFKTVKNGLIFLLSKKTDSVSE